MIVLGPIAAFLVYLLSAKIVYEARIMLSILVLTVIWWIFSKIPLAITALFSTTLMIVFGVASAGKAFSSYSHPLIFLFLGGFFIAKAIEKHGIDKRITLFILSRDIIAGKSSRV